MPQEIRETDNRSRLSITRYQRIQFCSVKMGWGKGMSLLIGFPIDIFSAISRRVFFGLCGFFLFGGYGIIGAVMTGRSLQHH